MLVVVIVALAAVFLFMLKRAGKHAAPFHESGMTNEPLPDVSISTYDPHRHSDTPDTSDRSEFSGDGGSGGGAGASDKW